MIPIAYDSVWVPETVGTFQGRDKFLALMRNLPHTVKYSVVNSYVISGSIISVVKVLRVIVASCTETFRFTANIFSEIVLA
jgi:hypothetical protein